MCNFVIVCDPNSGLSKRLGMCQQGDGHRALDDDLRSSLFDDASSLCVI